MHDEPRERDAALADLRRLLTDALASARMTKTQLAAQSKLSRTTVQQAFQTDSSAPSAETVVALAHVLNLPMEKLLDLRRTAAGETGVTPGQCKGPGKPVHEWNPHDLEVHPAEPTLNEYPSGAALGPILPGYVPRDHDQILTDAVRDAAQGHSQMVVLVGASSTGKTRACWEAVQLLAKQGWRLWHPFDPTRAQAALAELKQVQPRTVVWLNEAQHYLGDPRVGEEIAAAIHSLLIHPERRPVLVLGTLWPEYDDEYTALPSPGKSDPHSRVRELLAGRTHTVPDAFDKEALRKAAALAQGGDWLLANALTRTRANGRVTQDLAGVPELLRRYERGTPPARAVLEAAMDARRLGVGLHLPQSFLIEATIDYLSDHDYDELAEDWAESAFAELARPTHGRQAPLRRTKARPQRRRPGSPTGVATSAPATGPVFRLADYLEQHGRATRQALCPPASFWHAAYTHLTDLDELTELAEEAESRCRFQWANHLLHRAADAGNASALGKLAYMREEAGDHDGAEELARQAAEAGNPYPLLDLTRMRKEDSRSNEALARQAADAGNSYALLDLARMRKKAGDQKGAAAFYYEAANAGHVTALVELAEMREEDGDRDAAEALARSVAHAGDTHGLVALMRMREKAGDHDGAETLARQATDAGGGGWPFLTLAGMREESGHRKDAEAFFRLAADEGDVRALVDLMRMREKAGDHDGAETLARQAADAGDTRGLVVLAGMREKAGHRKDAEAFFRLAADEGDVRALVDLMRMREKAGDHDGAETLARQAADAGGAWTLLKDRWPHGLDPDGAPTPPWH